MTLAAAPSASPAAAPDPAAPAGPGRGRRPRPARTPRRLRPAVNAKLAVAGAGIIAVSVAGFAALVASVSGTQPVVAAAAGLSEGQVIAAGDLTAVAVAAEPSVPLIPAADLPSLIGQRAAADVPAGALLAPGSVTADPLPGPGRSLLGIAVGSAQAPLADPSPGTPVRLVHVPSDTAAPAAAGDGDAGDAVPAVVVSAGTDPAGARVLDVTVAAGDAARAARWASAGQIAVVVDSEAAR